MRNQKYIYQDATPEQVVKETAGLIQEEACNNNPQACLCVLYIILKAKSPVKGTWLWHPIPAYPQPQVRKRDLHTAARAYTCFLRHLTSEVPNSFQVL